mmetsp:Transcript_31207/g.69404  ORF Transcript_31207/g.69404 Transcript_31207/m.69404 type:complete len:405 (+) Transcript_31207:99-1313(+)|eukprot:CAMPEP_0202900076 /NCGR_PEP_ID=MMETSP1392-20130828/9681_1 /ASSEMBLY_ACC=CAM_ASM_000868 /TAXON_ID=225041 /ORGANISM="Chlamydomonas chlamydogama, Strain SAG 11-48b" /LENGTH=404 /DNA_ID=CAMNT_0049586393 /DNA_START=99 /DNA_END=1313 /DNA_ORIENTATION=+
MLASSQQLASRRAGLRACKPARGAFKVRAVAAAPKTARLDTASKSVVTPEVAKDLYYDMMLGREFEEMCAQMYYRGKMFGFVHLYSGQEAVSTGIIRALRPDDYVCSTYRDHVHALSKGVSAREVMAELFGKATGCCRGQGGSMHIFSAKNNFLGGYAFIGEGIPIGLGAAFQSRYRREVLGDEKADSVTASFFGDGTCNVGQFYESLNMAALYKLPHIFVVENNKWAIGMSHARATSTTSGDEEPYIYKKGPAFGMPGVLVDGMDVLKVREVALEAIERARRGDGPTLIECETYRFRGHSLADPDELRSKDEKAHYMARDPIPQLKKYMIDNGLATEADIKEIEKKVMEVVEDSVKFADESPKPEKGQLLENVFPDPRGFGIAEDGRYRYELPGFSSGTAAVS